MAAWITTWHIARVSVFLRFTLLFTFYCNSSEDFPIFFLCLSVKPFAQTTYPPGKPATAVSSGEVGALQAPAPPPWEGRAIATHKLRLVEFSAFMETQNREEAVS